jgi:uncharacterized damage-inducible protein DinB
VRSSDGAAGPASVAGNVLSGVLAGALRRQLASLDALAARLPVEAESSRPVVPGGAPTLRGTDELLGHLLDACGGFAAALQGLHPERLAWLDELRSPPLDRPLGAAAFRRELARLGAFLARALPELDDADLARSVPSALRAGGQTGLELLLWNLEHVASHRQDLFARLRAAGVAVTTADLYGLAEKR